MTALIASVLTEGVKIAALVDILLVRADAAVVTEVRFATIMVSQLMPRLEYISASLRSRAADLPESSAVEAGSANKVHVGKDATGVLEVVVVELETD